METRTTPQFDVVFKGEAMEPMADVAPTGEVKFVLVNESEAEHDFALVRLGPGDGAWEASTMPATAADVGVMALAPTVAPRDSATFTHPLSEGRYALVSNSRGELLGRSFFELTVQPPDGN